MNWRTYPALLFFAASTIVSCQKKMPATTGQVTTRAKASQNGLPGYQLTSIYDRVVPYDYNGTGKEDHLLCYRLGNGGSVSILENVGNYTFNAVWTTANNQSGGIGIGGYTMDVLPTLDDNYDEDGADHLLPFDGLNNGHEDMLVAYRPGSGKIWILQHINGGYTPIWMSGTGIAGCDLSSKYDKIITFDYDHTGHKNYLVIYRPGSKQIWIIRNQGNQYSLVVHGVQGIAGYDLAEVNDQCIAFDADNSGKEDHLLLYRPGVGTNAAIWLARHDANTTFTAQFTTHSGMPNFNLSQFMDRIMAYDYYGNGHKNQLLAYRSGTGTAGGPGVYSFNSNYSGFNQLFYGAGSIGGYPMTYFPVNGSQTYSGTKVVSLDGGNGLGTSTLLLYCAGVQGNWAYIETNTPPGTFTTVY